MTTSGSNPWGDLPEIITEVEKAATKGALQILGPRASPDLLADIVGEVRLRLVRRWKDNTPPNPAGWAFRVAQNCAKKVGKWESKREALNENVDLQDRQIAWDGENAPTLDAAMENLDRLLEITNQTIHEIGSETDRKICVLFHVRGLLFNEIASSVALSEAATRRRYYRLLKQVASIVRTRVRKDTQLSDIFKAILIDEQVFRCALLSLLNLVTQKGLIAVREILGSILD